MAKTQKPSDLSALTAVILCGGKGTRLREETHDKPKPMVPVGGRPILWHIMSHYRYYGVRRFVLCLGYLGENIRDYFINFRNRNSDLEVDLSNGAVRVLSDDGKTDWQIVMAETGDDSLTGTRVQRVLRYIDGDTFLATYGDGVADIDLRELYAYHRESGKLATVTAVHPSSRFGEIDINGGVVASFVEKPQVDAGWINGGFFVFDRKTFDGVDSAANVTLESDILETIARKRQLAVYQHDGFWQCMDTYREMQLLNELWDSARAPWAPWRD